MAYPTRLKNLQNCVEYVLQRFPESRNDDAVLTTILWEQYCRDMIFPIATGGFAVALDNVKYLPREEHVGRIRRKFQEKGKYLPTNEEVRKQRQISEEEWRIYLGKNPELRKVY